MNRHLKLILPFFITLLGLVACNIQRDADPISFGKDQCGFCKMTISNPKFGAELITDKGRIIKYDAAECMVNHLNNDAPKFQKLYAIAYDIPKELKAVDSLHFLISPDFRSPMGANLAAFHDIKKLDEKYHSQIIDWQTLLKSLR